MNPTISYGIAKSDEDLRQILALQKQNLATNLSHQEMGKEGFVTLQHNLELLRRMNAPYPHVIAKSEDEIVGYALVMLKSFSKEIPILYPMFEELKEITHQNKKLEEQSYFIMGQVCVKKGFRGQGILKGMYRKLQERMKADFDYMITEIPGNNQRSIQAHTKFGFEEIHRFQSDDDKKWSLILFNLRK